MNLIKYSVLLAGLLLGNLQLFSQARPLRGKVQDAEGPLPGVNVVIMNTNERVLVGVITDAKGEYYINVPDNATDVSVNYSFIGYKTQRVKYAGQRTQDIFLVEEARMLRETVVVGRGQRNDMGISIRNVVAATEKIELENMDQLPVTSLGDALQGKLANVDIVSGSGAPGSGSAIRIRGISSLSTSSEPLILLNGVPYNTQYADNFEFSTATDEDLSGLVNLSPGDIESVEVLKDAAATAIWGSRGANGVLVITTRRGSFGKMTTNITEKISINFEPERIKQLN
ncbi:MAG: TonB-dependent receptor plug domain-containing protein, partial [Odoribacteraceae bacterium]|nr:TonB-dependent receptor plug domain-containing protein [Odoribacteraceae bacterium]